MRKIDFYIISSEQRTCYFDTKDLAIKYAEKELIQEKIDNLEENLNSCYYNPEYVNSNFELFKDVDKSVPLLVDCHEAIQQCLREKRKTCCFLEFKVDRGNIKCESVEGGLKVKIPIQVKISHRSISKKGEIKEVGKPYQPEEIVTNIIKEYDWSYLKIENGSTPNLIYVGDLVFDKNDPCWFFERLIPIYSASLNIIQDLEEVK
jgi:hypothetical protein